MTKAQFRRWVIYVIEMTLKYSVAVIIMFCGCLFVCLFAAACLKFLGVA